ncbi:hypothetical protein [Citrobacter freundii complex sp. 2025EL-00176]
MAIRNEHEKEIDSRPLAIDNINFSKGELHPAQKLSERIADEEYEMERLRKLVPGGYIHHVNPEKILSHDSGKAEALLQVESKYRPVLQEQRDKLDAAYATLKHFEETKYLDVDYEIKKNPRLYYQFDYNDGFGTYKEDVQKAIQNIPEGFRLISVKPALRGSGSYIILSDKTDEEINALAEKNLLELFNAKLGKLKKELANQLKIMKELVKEYEDSKKFALQSDIEQLTAISTKYSKALK